MTYFAFLNMLPLLFEKKTPLISHSPNFYEKLLLIKEALFYGKMILSKVLNNVNKK